jgi:hypothetical protein
MAGINEAQLGRRESQIMEIDEHGQPTQLSNPRTSCRSTTMPSRSPLALLLLALSLPGAAIAAQPLSPPGSVDEQLLELGNSHSGFGGLFLDDEGKVNVFLVDPARDGGALDKALGTQTRILRGDYAFSELLGWRYVIRPLLGVAGVTMLDVDETRNRLVVGLEPGLPAVDREGLVARIAASGVPMAAVLVEDRPGFAELVNLQSKFRPVPGGVQIVFPVDLPLFGACTLGFNAKRGNVSGFVINSHCTGVRGEVDGVRYFQSVPSDGTIGSELADPGFFTDPPCPLGRRCRFSDSAFARYSNPKTGSLARIAKPASLETDPPTLGLTPASARFKIIGQIGSPLVGSIVDKVGRTTGWSVGFVLDTCADINVSGTDVTELCQSLVVGEVGAGDSGSPVFSRNSSLEVKLGGILWGGTSDPLLGTLFAFSPLANIEMELGPLKVK